MFVERLWRARVKYEEVYLRAYETVAEARSLIGRYLDFFNHKRPHSSLDARMPDSAPCSDTVRTARKRTSAEYRFADFDFSMAPTSQGSEPPAKPGAVQLGRLAIAEMIAVTAAWARAKPEVLRHASSWTIAI